METVRRRDIETLTREAEFYSDGALIAVGDRDG